MAAEGVIWDVDGTLVDTAEMHFQAWQEVSRELGRPFSHADFAATFGRRNPDILRFLFGDDLSERELTELAERKEALYREATAKHGVALLPGARSLLEGLQDAGFRQGIGSSAPRANLDLILKLTGIAGFFDAVVGSEEVQRGKPDPQVFLVTASHLKLQPARCLVLEDAVAGVEAARAGGMKCIAVTFVGHHPEEKLRGAGADLVVASLEDVTPPTVRELLTAAR